MDAPAREVVPTPAEENVEEKIPTPTFAFAPLLDDAYAAAAVEEPVKLAAPTPAHDSVAAAIDAPTSAMVASPADASAPDWTPVASAEKMSLLRL